MLHVFHLHCCNVHDAYILDKGVLILQYLVSNIKEVLMYDKSSVHKLTPVVYFVLNSLERLSSEKDFGK